MTFVCKQCCSYLSSNSVSNDNATTVCSICLGIFQSQLWTDSVKASIKTALQPYVSNNSDNRASPPTVCVPGDVVLRFYTAVASSSSNRDRLTRIFTEGIKHHAQTRVEELFTELISETNDNNQDVNDYTSSNIIATEQQGYLMSHVIILVNPSIVARPTDIDSTHNKHVVSRKRKYYDTPSQGGNPRVTLELKIQRQYNHSNLLWTVNQATAYIKRQNDQLKSINMETNNNGNISPLTVHATVWRQSFFIKGCYTKSRRDVSQTPFFVRNDDNNKKIQLGVTSVQEEITKVIAKHCGGISTLNNDEKAINTVYGMIKFHASGREDMDVRMLLPQDNDKNCGNITGRPFVCEVIDALNVPTALHDIVSDINTLDNGENLVPYSTRCYGRNAMGVGIADNLHFAPAESYKNLQAETEHKVKYYECKCWSKKALPKELLSDNLFPLTIHQATPIRVLHRRSNLVRTRHILTGYAERIDNHHFVLHISTDAGTYVKEFVHGDLGRTYPSMSSILDCETDILSLDCEGIQH